MTTEAPRTTDPSGWVFFPFGAEAYTAGDRVAFRGSPDLHTAAHEAAHVVQQRGGIAAKGGLGQPGDPYEQHADRVADMVVAGRSAEGELSRMAAPRSENPGAQTVQCKKAKDEKEDKYSSAKTVLKMPAPFW